MSKEDASKEDVDLLAKRDGFALLDVDSEGVRVAVYGQVPRFRCI